MGSGGTGAGHRTSFSFGFPPQVFWQKGVSSDPGQTFGHDFSLFGSGFGRGCVIVVFIIFMAELLAYFARDLNLKNQVHLVVFGQLPRGVRVVS